MTCQLIKLEFLVPIAISQHQEQTTVYIVSNSIVSCYIKWVFNFSCKLLNSKSSITTFNHVGLGWHLSTPYHYEMQKKFGVYTTFSVDGKKFHPIPIG